MARCAAIARSGEPCRGLVRAGNDYCPAHDPGRAAARSRAASKAARSKPTAELVVIRRRLAQLADDVLEGKTPTPRASVAAQCLGVAVRTFEVERRLRELGELEERLLALEERTGGKRRWG